MLEIKEQESSEKREDRVDVHEIIDRRSFIKLALLATASIISPACNEVPDDKLDLNEYSSLFKGLQKIERPPLDIQEAVNFINEVCSEYDFIPFTISTDPTNATLELSDQYYLTSKEGKLLEVEDFSSNPVYTYGNVQVDGKKYNINFEKKTNQLRIVERDASKSIDISFNSEEKICEIDVQLSEYSDEYQRYMGYLNEIRRLNSNGYQLRYLEGKTYKKLEGGEFELMEGIDDFLEYIKNDSGYKYRLEAPCDISNIGNMDQLIDLMTRFLNEPHDFVNFRKKFIKYELNDASSDDEFRLPLDTIRSGWGDCDDLVVLDSFWAILHGLDYRIIEIKYSDGFTQESNVPGRQISGHAFVVVKKNENLYYVLDSFGSAEITYSDEMSYEDVAKDAMEKRLVISPAGTIQRVFKL